MDLFVQHNLLLILAAFLSLFWMGTFKLCKGIRFETYFIDFNLGSLLSTLGLFTLLYSNYEIIPEIFPAAQTVQFTWLFRAFLAGILLNIYLLQLFAAASFCGLAFAALIGFSSGLAFFNAIFCYVAFCVNKPWMVCGVFFTAAAISCMVYAKKLPFAKSHVVKRCTLLTSSGGVFLALF